MKDSEEATSKVSISEVRMLALTLYSMLTEQERKQLVTECLKQFDRLTPKTRQFIESKLQRTLKIPGFAKFMSVPLAMRIDALIQYSLKHQYAAALVLVGWFERKYPIYQAIGDYITTHQKPVIWGLDEEAVEAARTRGNGESQNQGEAASITDICQVDETFMQMHPDFTRFDIIMAAACGEPFEVADPHTDADEGLHSPIEEDDAPWASWLAQAEALPAQHSAWQQLDNFIGDLRALFETKRELLAQQGAIHTALVKLRAVDGELLQRLFLDNVTTWQLPNSLLEPMAPIVAQLDELLAKIEEYRQVEAWSQSNRVERQAKWQRLSELAGEAEAIELALHPLFSDIPSPDLSPNSTVTIDLTHEAEERQRVDESQVTQAQRDDLAAPIAGVEQTTPASNYTAPGQTPLLFDLEGETDFDLADETPSVHEEEAPEIEDDVVETQLAVALDLVDGVEEEAMIASTTSLELGASGHTGGAFDFDAEHAWLEPEDDDPPFLLETAALGSDSLDEEVEQIETAFWLDTEVVANAEVDLNVAGQAHSTPDAAVSVEADNAERTTPASIRSSDDDEYLWEMVKDGDLAGAYWFSCAMSKVDKAPAIPAELLAAVQGSAWLTAETMLPYAEDLREIARHYQPDQMRFEHLLLGVAAALPPILLAPSSELLDWLNVPAEYGWLVEFVTPIREFGFYGVGLSADVLPGVTDGAQLEEQQRQIVAQANEWRTTASQRRSHFKRAVDVWHDLIKPQGELGKLLQPVLDNDIAALDAVRQELIRWQNHSSVETIIDDIDHALRATKRPRIDGSIREYLKRAIAEACRHATAWVRVTEEMGKQTNQGDWLAKQATNLLAHLKQTLPGVIAAITELQQEVNPLPQRAATEVLANALRHVARIFGIDERLVSQLPGQPLATWAKGPYPQWATQGTDSIAQALKRRLLMLPDVVLADDGAPTDAAWQVIFGEIEIALHPIPHLFDCWLEKQDYRFIGLLLALHPARTGAEERYTSELDGSRAALQALLQETQGSIEQAVVDGIINDVQRTEYLGQVVGVKATEVKNFAAEFDRLDALENELREAKILRMGQLQQQWSELSEALRLSFVDEQRQQIIANFLNDAVARKDTRLVEESLAHLRTALETNHDLEIDDWFALRHESDIFQHFLGRLGELSRFLERSPNLREMLAAIKQGHNVAGLEFSGVPRKRLDEAEQALDAWSRLKKSPPKPNQKNLLRTYVSEILSYLGFALTSSDAARTEGVQVDDMGSDYVALSASLTHGDLARPIPQFGSQAHGQYRIVCIWERPSIDAIVAQLTESNLTSLPVLAFYLGRLTSNQRRELVQRTREDRLPLALLDETLLVYLSAAHKARFPIFLRCALPYATLSPYALQAGNVPPEIFYGRQDAIKRLSEQQGSCIVYGGRQLGKSALLRQVQRGFHHPEREDYAFFVDIKNVGDPHGVLKTGELWAKIRESLKEEGLFKKQVTTTRPSEVARLIHNLLSERPQARLLFLLDEADNFLDADAQSNFQEVDRLRSLMGDTNRRFRVIFAGLHNVQRFQGIPNQPLAHFGDPLLVGPLEAKAALDLVREPLQVLGFRFADDSVPLRMLSYTNYHPSLIQLFCQELLQRLHRPLEIKAPPYTITQSDVEAVYRRQEVGDRIRERFDWTLALDPRYQTIAYALVENQLESADSYGASYSIPDVLRLVQSWWQNGFKEIDQSRLQGLLDEMVGLGILVRGQEGRYRLRSPNLVRLMGSRVDIESRLLEFSTRPAPTEYSADYFHALLSDAKPHYQYSPLTYAQERALTRHQSGVTLLFASEAQGFANLPSALRKFGHEVSDIPVCVVEELASLIAYPDQLKEQLMKSWKGHGNAEQIFLYYQVKSRLAVDVYALVECALQYCASLQAAQRSLQVIFLFDDEAAGRWLATAPQRRQNIEEMAAVFYPYQWDRSAICQRLEQESKQDLDDICKLITEVTGGWPFLLDIIMQRSGGEQNLRPLTNTLAKELKQPKSDVYSQFRRALGVAEGSTPATLLHFIVDLLNDSHDLIEAELLALVQSENEELISAQEFQNVIEYLVRMGCLRRNGENFILAPWVYQLFKQS